MVLRGDRAKTSVDVFASANLSSLFELLIKFLIWNANKPKINRCGLGNADVSALSQKVLPRFYAGGVSGS